MSYDLELPVIGNFSLRGDISKAWSFEFNIERDSVFQNIADFRLKTRTDHFGFEFGILSGITDDFDQFGAGFLGSIEFTLPGILFLSVNGSSTLSSPFGITGDNFLETAGAKFGFWLPFAVITLSADTKSFIKNTGICDNLIRYTFSADFFRKTSNFSLRLDGGYHTLSRGIYGAEDPIEELNSFFAGLDFQFNVSKNLRFIIGGEIPFLFDEAAPEDLCTRFKAYGGIRITIF
jgi:hypothetical protein